MTKHCECGCGGIVKNRFVPGHHAGAFRRDTFIGRKFNYLTVIDVGPRNEKNFVTWKCQCICGNIKNVPTGYLTQNSTKSCGCMSFKSEIHGNQTGNPQKVTWNSIINAYKQEAKRNSREWLLSDEQALKLFSSTCFYCGDAPTNKRNVYITKNGKQRTKNTLHANKAFVLFNGIDRVDSSKGYSIDNCVSCCSTCNFSKHEMSQIEFYSWVEKVWRHLNENSSNK